MVCIDGLSKVLMQQGNPIFYKSRKLKEKKNNYATHNLELSTIVLSLKVWRHYAMGRKFNLRTDHISMKYLFDQTKPNARKERCLEYLCEFKFDIKHVKGKENIVADTLSKKFHIAAISECRIDLRMKVLEYVVDDQFYLSRKEEFEK